MSSNHYRGTYSLDLNWIILDQSCVHCAIILIWIGLFRIKIVTTVQLCRHQDLWPTVFQSCRSHLEKSKYVKGFLAIYGDNVDFVLTNECYGVVMMIHDNDPYMWCPLLSDPPIHWNMLYWFCRNGWNCSFPHACLWSKYRAVDPFVLLGGKCLIIFITHSIILDSIRHSCDGWKPT